MSPHSRRMPTRTSPPSNRACLNPGDGRPPSLAHNPAPSTTQAATPVDGLCLLIIIGMHCLPRPHSLRISEFRSPRSLHNPHIGIHTDGHQSTTHSAAPDRALPALQTLPHDTNVRCRVIHHMYPAIYHQPWGCRPCLAASHHRGNNKHFAPAVDDKPLSAPILMQPRGSGFDVRGSLWRSGSPRHGNRHTQQHGNTFRGHGPRQHDLNHHQTTARR